MNPVQRDMAFANGTFITETRHIMLLTMEEAQEIVDTLMGGTDKIFSYKLAPGNIKDILEGTANISNLMTYKNSAGDLVFHFKSLGVRAIEYTFKGKSYIKITGRAGLRQILKGTRYAVNHPQMLEMGIGYRGIGGALVKGMKFCIFASVAWRALELIFKSDYHLADFLVDVSVDAVKTIVAGVVLGIAGGILTVIGAPVVVSIFLVIVVGIYLNKGLNELDDSLGLSVNLKEKLRLGIAEYQKVNEWNFKNSKLFLNTPVEFGY
ncbi:hypothetical protein BV494_22230 (plasmid) [Rahnella sikkimica]|uniref:ImpA domain-containing protein n=2 Tax=Rahnella sikkimica TaxID=1805933 RepID=A0A2L1UYB4_9GAMM|nr:hypothetical protein BV494_22230 [Rahnella sikkimica]